MMSGTYEDSWEERRGIVRFVADVLGGIEIQSCEGGVGAGAYISGFNRGLRQVEREPVQYSESGKGPRAEDRGGELRALARGGDKQAGVGVVGKRVTLDSTT